MIRNSSLLFLLLRVPFPMPVRESRSVGRRSFAACRDALTVISYLYLQEVATIAARLSYSFRMVSTGIMAVCGMKQDNKPNMALLSVVDYTGSSKSLGTQKWETPVGKMVEGMENVKNFYSGYGDGPPFGNGPAQGKIHSGPRYIEENFPLLDHFKTCTVQRGVAPVADVSEPKRIRDENQHESKQHKKQQAAVPNLTEERVPRLNDGRKQALLPRRSDTWTHAFAAFAVIILVLLMIFGYRKSGRKGSKKS